MEGWLVGRGLYKELEKENPCLTGNVWVVHSKGERALEPVHH